MKKHTYLTLIMALLIPFLSCGQQGKYIFNGDTKEKNDNPRAAKPLYEVKVGAADKEAYLPLLKGKRVAALVNQTSEVAGELLPDLLQKNGVNLVVLFTPEHGFRGTADAGAKVQSGKDEKTGLPLISLYGNNKKPTAEQLKNVDVVIYDLQDVGARFYTYISSLEYLIEACAENNKTLIILDRPNPLGNLVDGPVLDPKNRSFVGMQAIPIVYGMTPGEYAKMLVGEKWVKASGLKLEVIKCQNYTHRTLYKLPVSPSPNLKNMAAIYLYPSLCLFEGTDISLGRGTETPFQQYGHPDLVGYSYSFTPKSMPGATSPPLMNKKCYGEMLASDANTAYRLTEKKLELSWLLKAYKNFPNKDKFFNSFFIKLAGTAQLQQQIQAGLTETEIRATWEPKLSEFKTIRAKYLLYGE